NQNQESWARPLPLSLLSSVYVYARRLGGAYLGNAHLPVAKLPGVSVGVLLRSHDFWGNVLGILDDCALFQNHKVDVLASACLGIAACAVCCLVNGGVEPALGNTDHP